MSDLLPDVLTESAPERIWLQVDSAGDPDDRADPIMRESWSEMTWCAEQIGGQEIEYVRADLAARSVGVDAEMVERACVAGATVVNPCELWPEDFAPDEQAQARKMVRAILEAALGAAK